MRLNTCWSLLHHLERLFFRHDREQLAVGCHKRTGATLAKDTLGNQSAWLRILNGDSCSVVQISRTNNKSLGERAAAAASQAIFGNVPSRA